MRRVAKPAPALSLSPGGKRQSFRSMRSASSSNTPRTQPNTSHSIGWVPCLIVLSCNSVDCPEALAALRAHPFHHPPQERVAPIVIKKLRFFTRRRFQGGGKTRAGVLLR